MPRPDEQPRLREIRTAAARTVTGPVTAVTANPSTHATGAIPPGAAAAGSRRHLGTAVHSSTLGDSTHSATPDLQVRRSVLLPD